MRQSLSVPAIVSALAAVALISANLDARDAQSPPPATGLIVGRVIEATANTPIRGVVVVLTNVGGRDSGRVGVMTDANGQFVIGGLPAGSFRLTATRFGYAEGAYGRGRPNSHTGDEGLVVLKADEHLADLTIRLWKYGVITGTVVDEFGEPAVNVELRAFRREFVAGRPKLVEPFLDQTDDRGAYRFAHLIPGDYVVAIVRSEGSSPLSLMEQIDQSDRAGDRDASMAGFMDVEMAGVDFGRPGWPGALRVGSSVYGLGTPPAGLRNGRLFVYPPQFYGGSSDVAAARTISVRPGQEITGIDFSMKPVPSVRVSGHVVDQNGPAANVPVRLTSVNGGDFAIDRSPSANVAITDKDGKFTLLGVLPGEKVLRLLKGPPMEEGMFGIVSAQSVSDMGAILSTNRDMIMSPAPPPDAPTLFATTTLGIADADIDNLSLVVRNGVRIRGRVEFIGATPQPSADAIKQLRIDVEQKNGLAFGWEFEMSGKVSADKTFETAEIPPGAYLLIPHVVPGWALESVTVGGRDVSDVPLDIVDKPIGSVVVRYTDKPSILSGMVRVFGRDESLDDATVFVLPTDRTRSIDYGPQPRRLRQVGVRRDGTFIVEGLPPGEYFVAAIHDDFLTEWLDPAMLNKISAIATRVVIQAGEQKSQSVSVARIR